MSEKREKKDKLKSVIKKNKNFPLPNDTKRDRAWENIYQLQTIKWNNAKNTIKGLTDQLRKSQKNEAEKEDTIENLKQTNEKLKEELAKCIEERNALKSEGKSTKLSLLEKDHKYTDLEENYDKNITSLNLEISKINQEKQAQVTSNAKLATEFAATLKEQKSEILQQTEKITELEEQIKQLQQNFQEEKESINKSWEERFTAQMLDLDAMRAGNELKNEELIKLREEMLELGVAKNLELEAKCTENLLKDEQLIKIQNENSQVEKAKNNEIRELNAKLAAVNRILKQQRHVKEVQPIIEPSHHRENTRHTVAPNVPNNNTTAIGESSSQSNRRRSERIIPNDIPTVSQSTSQLVRNRSIIVNDEPNSSESDTDISIFRPDSSFNRNYMVEGAPRPQGFGRLKRPYQAEFEILETSDSENNFDKMKRSK